MPVPNLTLRATTKQRACLIEGSDTDAASLDHTRLIRGLSSVQANQIRSETPARAAPCFSGGLCAVPLYTQSMCASCCFCSRHNRQTFSPRHLWRLRATFGRASSLSRGFACYTDTLCGAKVRLNLPKSLESQRAQLVLKQHWHVMIGGHVNQKRKCRQGMVSVCFLVLMLAAFELFSMTVRQEAVLRICVRV